MTGIMIEQAKSYAIVGLTVALAVGGAYHLVAMSYLELECTAAKAKASVLAGRNEQLMMQREHALRANRELVLANSRQTVAIAEWRAAVDRAETTAAAAVAKVKADNKELQARYARLLKDPPAKPDDLCASLETRLDQYYAARLGERQ